MIAVGRSRAEGVAACATGALSAEREDEGQAENRERYADVAK